MLCDIEILFADGLLKSLNDSVLSNYADLKGVGGLASRWQDFKVGTTCISHLENKWPMNLNTHFDPIANATQ